MITKICDENGATVQLSSSEILIINNSLNEICNAFALSDFETRMGATVGEVSALLKSMRQLLDSSEEGKAANDVAH